MGFVFTAPGGLDGLTASLDFYNIEVEDAIATFEGGQIYDRCFNRNGVSNPGMTINDPGGFCALINRNESTGAAGTVDSRYLNAALIETSGIDLQVNWNGDLGDGWIAVRERPGELPERVQHEGHADRSGARVQGHARRRRAVRLSLEYDGRLQLRRRQRRRRVAVAILAGGQERCGT